MTMTTNDDKSVNEARQLRRELIDDELLDAMLASTSERGISLTGEGGFLPELIKSVLERGMNAELTSHLGYEKNGLLRKSWTRPAYAACSMVDDSVMWCS